jgi:hypothetical protein
LEALVNEKIMQEAGFGKQVEAVKEGKCPFCNKIVNASMFRDKLSYKEFRISGLCQICQDKTFGGK